MDLLLDRELGDLEAIAVERHQDRSASEGAPLVHAPATRGRRDLSLVGQLHLVPGRETEVVDPVEGPRHEDAGGGARGKPLLDRQIRLEAVDHEPAHGKAKERSVRHPGQVAPKAAALGHLRERFRLHRDLLRAVPGPIRQGRLQEERIGVLRDLGVNPLIRAGDQGIPLLDLRVEPAVPSGRVRMLAEETEATGNEEPHDHLANPPNLITV